MTPPPVTVREYVKAQMTLSVAPAHLVVWSQIRSTALMLFVILWFHKKLFATTAEMTWFLAIAFVIALLIGLQSGRVFKKRLNQQMEIALSHFAGKEDLFDLPMPGQSPSSPKEGCRQ